jgi:hypothetical protein
VVIGAVEDCGEASFGVEHSVAVGADAHAVCLPMELAPWAFARGAGAGELRVGGGVAPVAVTDGVDAVAVPGFWSWAAVSGAAFDHRERRRSHGSTTRSRARARSRLTSAMTDERTSPVRASRT